MDGEPGFSEIPQEIYLKYSDLFRRLIDREDCLLQVMFNDKRDVNILFVNDGRAIFMEDAVYLAFFSSFVDGHENGNCMEIDPDIAFFCFWIKNTGKLEGFCGFWEEMIGEWDRSVHEWAPNYRFDLRFVPVPNREFPGVRISLVDAAGIM